MSKFGLFLLWFGCAVAISISLITTGASFNYAGANNFFAAPPQTIALIFYQQVAINFVAFALLSALWDGLRHLWPRVFNNAHRIDHPANRSFYMLSAGLGAGALCGFYQVAVSPAADAFITLGSFFKALGIVSLPITIIAAVYESARRLRHKQRLTP